MGADRADKHGLAVGGHQGDDLILDGLHTALDFLAQALFDDFRNLLLAGVDAQILHFSFDIAADLLAADIHKRSQMRKADALAAVLAGRTCAIIWVAMLQAVEKECGFSISVPEITVPFCSISSRLTRSQLCMCWA